MQHISIETPRPERSEHTVADLMSSRVWSCHRGETLDRAAQRMWDHDCGALVVVDDHGRTIGVITDRDICMAAHFQGLPLSRIPVAVAASHRVHTVRPQDPLQVACDRMRQHRVRRLPVVDVGGNLVGILSLADIVRRARSDPSIDVSMVTAVLTDVARPSRPPPPP